MDSFVYFTQLLYAKSSFQLDKSERRDDTVYTTYSNIQYRLFEAEERLGDNGFRNLPDPELDNSVCVCCMAY